MTANELILKNKHEVRRDSNLMSLYLKYFQEAFNKLPNCAGCSFASDWQKLVSFHSKPQTQKVMNTISNTITIKKIHGKILSYKKDGKTYRQYDNILTDSFIKEYISNGTKEEIAERKKMFNFTAKNEVESSEYEHEITMTVKNENSEAYEYNKESIFSESELNTAEKLITNLTHSQTKKRGRKPKK